MKVPLITSYGTNMIIWGFSGVAAFATFTEGIPILQDKIYSKIPFIGSYWINKVDPEDIPE